MDLTGYCLTEDQKEEAKRFLSGWKRIVSQGSTHLGCTRLILHEINLDDERHFKKPYHHIPVDLECDHCIKRKAGQRNTAELVNIISTAPMEIFILDYLSLERSKGVVEHILVITNHFTRYAQVIPTTNQTARTTARVLFDHFVVHYGFPAKIHNDQGQSFESKMIEELCKIAGTETSRTTPYHPMENSQCKRFNQTLLIMLGTLAKYQKSDWKSHVPS